MPDREHAGEPAIIITVPAVIQLAAEHAANIKNMECQISYITSKKQSNPTCNADLQVQHLMTFIISISYTILIYHFYYDGNEAITQRYT
ncbi:hypothetical protein, partial [Enterobacter asburiae]|uniref:hypothetical protein n=1 Tax=Enterobacter asburiae TaxID=61645 RepID=UPI003D6E8A30